LHGTHIGIKPSCEWAQESTGSLQGETLFEVSARLLSLRTLGLPSLGCALCGEGLLGELGLSQAWKAGKHGSSFQSDKQITSNFDDEKSIRMI
jgi:hypothetical protein